MEISTGLRNAILDSSPFRTALGGCVLNIYAGTRPATADAALGGDAVLLCTVSSEGGGGALNWEATASGGVLSKSTSETWKGTAAATGTAAFFRMQLASDAGAASSTAVRMQGSVDVLGADLNMSSVDFTSGAIETIDYATVTLPASI